MVAIWCKVTKKKWIWQPFSLWKVGWEPCFVEIVNVT